jgi:hypothetical protein
MTQRPPSWRRRASLAAALPWLLFSVSCDSERSTGPEPPDGIAELYVSANVQSTTVTTLVVRVSAADIQPTLVFNLTIAGGTASGMLQIPAGTARTITAQAFDADGIETHGGEKTLDIRPGANNPTVSITLLPIAGSQPLELRLGTVTVTVTQVPVSLRVGERATLSATVAGPDGPIPFAPEDIRWATATPGTLAVDKAGVVTGVAPGEGKVAATYAGSADLATITLEPRLGYYASPAVLAGGAGTWENPWDLKTALSGAGGTVKPGDFIWLRGGQYVGDFRSSLTGTAAQSIVVRQYPGERATIVGQLRAEGAYTTYWGFEIRQDDPMAPLGPPALQAYAVGGKYVNLIIHDAGENGISFRTATGESEIYGCILFNNGNTEGLDHGIYSSSEATVVEKRIVDNVLFNNLGSGIQVFGDATHSAIKNVGVIGNISFNNSSIAVTRPGGEENINWGGDQTPVENIVVENNLLYFSPNVSTGNNMRAGQEIRDPGDRNISTTIRNNYIVGGSARSGTSNTLLRLDDWEQATVEGNTFIAAAGERVVRLNDLVAGRAGLVWSNNTHYQDPNAQAWRHNATNHTWDGFKAATQLGATDVVIATPPSTTKIVVRPNAYEPGRANIAIYSPTGLLTSVGVDVSGILQPGDRYEVRNVQDIFGPPMLSGIYSGELLVLPMAGVAPPPAIGRGIAPVTGPYFNAFLLTRPQP